MTLLRRMLFITSTFPPHGVHACEAALSDLTDFLEALIRPPIPLSAARPPARPTQAAPTEPLSPPPKPPFDSGALSPRPSVHGLLLSPGRVRCAAVGRSDR